MNNSPCFAFQYRQLTNLIRHISNLGSRLRPLTPFELILRNKTLDQKGLLLEIMVEDHERSYRERDLNELKTTQAWNRLSTVGTTI